MPVFEYDILDIYIIFNVTKPMKKEGFLWLLEKGKTAWVRSEGSLPLKVCETMYFS
ncbi:hypothetical protein KP78_15420 [Jeotgalibacillus soli]|uniref:Uncharacterized protein n=1 Tax=Jeotgalibacillus soli TaxID=889306 RepID=A0A0C2VIB5_9BACL|nr:hypothetical protein KP78_15420 [Jeotgalibacillus soli]